MTIYNSNIISTDEGHQVLEWELVELHTGSGRISQTIGWFLTEQEAHEYVRENAAYSPYAGGHYDIINVDDQEKWSHYEKLDHLAFHLSNPQEDCQFCQ